jgi:hypothetical protein
MTKLARICRARDQRVDHPEREKEMLWLARVCLWRALFPCIGIAVSGALPAAGFAAAPPPNDDFSSARDLGSGATSSLAATNLWATGESGEPAHSNSPTASSVWFRWSAPGSGPVSVRTCGSDFDTVLAVYEGTALAALAPVATNDDGCGQQGAVRFFAVAGATYFIAVAGFDGAQGRINLSLRVETPPPNDDFNSAQDLGSVLSASVSGTNRDATVEAGEPRLSTSRRRARASVWYRWTAPATRRVRIATCGSDFDTVLGVYNGSVIDALRLRVANDDSCGSQSVVRFKARAGITYRIAVDSYGAAVGSIKLKVRSLRRQP